MNNPAWRTGNTILAHETSDGDSLSLELQYRKELDTVDLIQ
jgi:hypothetical protein